MAGEQEDWPDRAVQMMAAMGRRLASQLRTLAPRPFGLIGRRIERPAVVGSFSQEHAAQTRELPPVTSMTLCYGTAEDPASPYIEVSTDFSAGHGDTAGLRFALRKAVSSEIARVAGELDHGVAGNPPPGPLDWGQLEIVIAGQRRTVRTQTYQAFSGLQFSHSGLRVTAIARGHWPDQPEFAIITDLEPYLAAMESSDPEVIRARLRARYPGGPPR